MYTNFGVACFQQHSDTKHLPRCWVLKQQLKATTQVQREFLVIDSILSLSKVHAIISVLILRLQTAYSFAYPAASIWLAEELKSSANTLSIR